MAATVQVLRTELARLMSQMSDARRRGNHELADTLGNMAAQSLINLADAEGRETRRTADRSVSR